LRRVGEDRLDTQVLQSPAELGLEIRVCRAEILLVGAEFIQINSPGLAMALQIPLPETEYGNDAFMRGECSAKNTTRRIVDGGEQAHLRSAFFEPELVGSVELH